MPPIAKTVGLILVVVSPVCLAAQTARSGTLPPERCAAASAGYTLPFGQIGGFGADPARAEAPQYLQAGSPVGKSALVSSEPSQGVPLSPQGGQSPLPLSSPERSDGTQRDPDRGLPRVATVVGSLALVLGVFFLLAWGMRRATPAGSSLLPGEVFEILGRAPLASRQQAHLLRCGNKLLLVSVTPTGAETLAEITDPVEVDRLAGLCRQTLPNSATAVFRQVFGQFASRRSEAGVFGASDREDWPPAAAHIPGSPGGLEQRDV